MNINDEAVKMLENWRKHGYRYMESRWEDDNPSACAPIRWLDSIPKSHRELIDQHFTPEPGLIRYFTIPESGDVADSHAYIELVSTLK